MRTKTAGAAARYVNAADRLPLALFEEALRHLDTNQVIQFSKIGAPLNSAEAKLGYDLVRKIRRVLGLQFRGAAVYFSPGREASRVRQGRPPAPLNQQALFLIAEGWPIDVVCGALCMQRAVARAVRRRLALGAVPTQPSSLEFSEALVQELAAKLTAAEYLDTIGVLLLREGVLSSGDAATDLMKLSSSRYAGLEPEAADLATRTLVELCAAARLRLSMAGWAPPTSKGKVPRALQSR